MDPNPITHTTTTLSDCKISLTPSSTSTSRTPTQGTLTDTTSSAEAPPEESTMSKHPAQLTKTNQQRADLALAKGFCPIPLRNAGKLPAVKISAAPFLLPVYGVESRGVAL